MSMDDDQRLLHKGRLQHLRRTGVRFHPNLIPGQPLHEPVVTYREGELLVGDRWADQVLEKVRIKSREIEVKQTSPDLGLVRLFGPGIDPLSDTRQLRADNEEWEVGPNYTFNLGQPWRIGPATDPEPEDDAPLFADGSEPSGAKVGVLDTGMWEAHPGEPAARLGSMTDSPHDVEHVDQDNNGRIDWFGNAHGGFIAGIIKRHAPQLRLRADRAFETNLPDAVLDAFSLNTAAQEAINEGGVDVLNLSLGTHDVNGGLMLGLRQAMRQWKKLNPRLLVVAAAGNQATDKPWYPAAFAVDEEFRDWVISVGALEESPDASGSRRAPYSNFGEWVLAWAPGEHVSVYPRGKVFRYDPDDPANRKEFNQGFARWTGTSFATPCVLAAICKRALGQIDPLQAWHDQRDKAPLYFDCNGTHGQPAV
jgi:hypothetical protein